MSLDLPTLRAELRQLLGVDSDDLPDDTDLANNKVGANLLLNQAYWELLDKFPFREKEISATFLTVAGTRYYQIPSMFEALRQLSIEDVESQQHTVIERATVYEYETLFVNTSAEQGKPTKYVREKNGIRFWRTPDQVYTITIKYWAVLSDLSSGNPTPEIPQSWHEIILAGAVWRGFFHLGDHARMASSKAIHTSLINSAVPVEAKEEFDTHLGGVEVAGLDGDL